MDTIFIESIEFYAYHGATDDEQRVGHRYCVSVELGVDTTKAASTDALEDTVNYAHVAKRVATIGTNEQFRLLEKLAGRIAEALLTEFEIETVRVRVRKLMPPMNVIAGAVGVEIERRR